MGKARIWNKEHSAHFLTEIADPYWSERSGDARGNILRSLFNAHATPGPLTSDLRVYISTDVDPVGMQGLCSHFGYLANSPPFGFNLDQVGIDAVYILNRPQNNHGLFGIAADISLPILSIWGRLAAENGFNLPGSPDALIATPEFQATCIHIGATRLETQRQFVALRSSPAEPLVLGRS